MVFDTLREGSQHKRDILNAQFATERIERQMTITPAISRAKSKPSSKPPSAKRESDVQEHGEGERQESEMKDENKVDIDGAFEEIIEASE